MPLRACCLLIGHREQHLGSLQVTVLQVTFLDEQQFAAHLVACSDKRRTSSPNRDKATMAQSSHQAGPAPEAGPMLLQEADHSLMALQFAPALGTAAMMAQITKKQHHSCFPSILVRGRATRIAQKSRTHIGLQRGSRCQYKVPDRQDRGRQARQRDVDIQVNLLHTGIKISIKKKKNPVWEY